MVDLGFFEEYPQFVRSRGTAAWASRLNWRYEGLIRWNADILRGARVLDIASHDGRWSFAALDAGASHVLGIEVREKHVEDAQRAFAELDVDRARFEFRVGDVFAQLPRVREETIDVVLCFGFFYHTLEHARLLHLIANIEPKYLVLDTHLGLPMARPSEAAFRGFEPMAIVTKALSDLPLIVMLTDSPSCDGDGVTDLRRQGGEGVLVGAPTLGGLEALLESQGFSDLERYEWRTRWPVSAGDGRAVSDYLEGMRTTIRARYSGSNPRFHAT